MALKTRVQHTTASSQFSVKELKWPTTYPLQAYSGKREPQKIPEPGKGKELSEVVAEEGWL